MSETNQLQRVVNFKYDDVIAVAKAHSEDAVLWDRGDLGSRNPHDGYTCSECYGEHTENITDFVHKPDCTVLIALDLLTGS